MKNKSFIVEDLVISHRKKYSRVIERNTYHNAYEIYFLLNGCCHLFVKDKIYELEKGDLILIKENEIHKVLYVDKSTRYERFVIYFKKSFLEGCASNIDCTEMLQDLYDRDICQLSFDPHTIKTVKDLINQIILEQNEKKSYFEQAINSLLLQILIIIIRFMDGYGRDKVIEESSRGDTKFEEIIQFINANYDKNLSLDYIADQFYISKYYLSHLFKEKSGFTVIEYINNKRIMEAQGLLNNSNYNITDIAYRVGFNNSTHFWRTFKKATGLTPSEFRKLETTSIRD